MTQIKRAEVKQHSVVIEFEDGKTVDINSDERRLHLHFSGLGVDTKIVPGERSANTINVEYVPFDPPRLTTKELQVEGNAKIVVRDNGVMELWMMTPFGRVDLQFEDVKQFRRSVSGECINNFDAMIQKG